jgi:DNA polymerase III alpha subunit (gram-positive type)
MIKANYIVYDCETGGLDEYENPITQFACMVLDYKTLKEVDRWETFVKPYADLTITKESLEKSLVSLSDIKKLGMDLRPFINTMEKFVKMHLAVTKSKDAGRLIPIGHNVQFDNRFLRVAFELVNKDWNEYISDTTIDTMALSKMMFGLEGTEKLKLGECCKYAGVKLTDAHGAMNDVIATADLFRFYTKKLRRKANDNTDEKTGRATGTEFFEFTFNKK